MTDTTPSTLFDKVWNAHVIDSMDDGWALLHIDRRLVHDLSGARAFAELDARGLRVKNPQSAFATPDHAVSSAPGRTGMTFPGGAALWSGLRDGAARHQVRMFDLGRPGHGIVHVIAPELGIVQPGSTLVCGDSHTCTSGALGAMAFGVGWSELVHALATQALLQRKPRNMRIRFEGALPAGATAKDLILFAIGRLGASAGTGHAVEFAGPAIEALSVEERMTVCNLCIEMGAKIGMIAPDQKVVEYLAGRPFSPSGEQLHGAVEYWRSLRSDDHAAFDREESIDAGAVVPMVTWGTSPEQVTGVDGRAPLDADAPDEARRSAWQDARAYMGLQPGEPLAGLKVDRVFIGSCTNARLSDLRAAASLIQGRRVAAHVRAWVVPGSEEVRLAAQAEGLDKLFGAAGFQWREPGCSMCLAVNGEIAAPMERVVSTSNRNFVGRQGPGARTHLASPTTAVASALAGCIADPREL